MLYNIIKLFPQCMNNIWGHHVFNNEAKYSMGHLERCLGEDGPFLACIAHSRPRKRPFGLLEWSLRWLQWYSMGGSCWLLLELRRFHSNSSSNCRYRQMYANSRPLFMQLISIVLCASEILPAGKIPGRRSGRAHGYVMSWS